MALSDKLQRPKKFICWTWKWSFLGVLMGLIGGLLGAVFHHVLHFVTHLRLEHTWLVLLLPVGGLLTVGWYRLLKLKRNRGTNEIIDAILNGEKVNPLIAPTIFLATAATHLFGGSAGREGAALQLGGSTASMAVAYGTTAFFPSMNTAFAFTAIVTGILVILWVLCVRQEDFEANAPVEAVEQIPIRKGILTAVKSKNVWLMGLALAAMLGGATVISNFQVVYLVSHRNYSEAVAGTFGTVLMVGAIIGSVGIPMFISKIKNPGVFLFAITLIAGACTAGMVILPVAGVYVASFLNGFLRSGAISLAMVFPVMFPEIGPRYAGTATGVASTIQLFGAVVIPTYVIIPLAGGNMEAYFYWGAAFFAISAVLLYILGRKLKFN